MSNQTEKNKRIENNLTDLLWEYLPKDKEHEDRRQTGWGTKTKTGLRLSIARIMSDKVSFMI